MQKTDEKEVFTKLDVHVDNISRQKIREFVDNLVNNSRASQSVSSFLILEFEKYFHQKKDSVLATQLLSSNLVYKQDLIKIIAQINVLVDKAQISYQETKLEPFLVYKRQLSLFIIDLVREVSSLMKNLSKPNQEHDYSFTRIFSDVLNHDEVSGRLIFDHFLENTQESEILKEIDVAIQALAQQVAVNVQIHYKFRNNEIQCKLEEFKKTLYQALENSGYQFPEMKNQAIVDMYNKLERMEIKQVIGDGHCLARSIAYLIYANQDYFPLVYHQVITFLEKNNEAMNELVVPYGLNSTDILQHLKKISKLKVVFMEDWPNNMVYLQLIAEAFSVNLELFYFEEFPKYTDVFRPLLQKEKERKLITIANLNNSHYCPLDQVRMSK